jgi:hypothetical protein
MHNAKTILLWDMNIIVTVNLLTNYLKHIMYMHNILHDSITLCRWPLRHNIILYYLYQHVNFVITVDLYYILQRERMVAVHLAI